MIMKSPSLNYQVGWKKYGLKTQHMLNVCVHTVVQCTCTCNADVHIFHETNIFFLENDINEYLQYIHI